MTHPSDLNPLAALSRSLTALVAQAAPSVVSVHSHRALSSGFVWKPNLIVTADDALADEGEIAVTVFGGSRVAASLVGRDPTTDIALLRIEPNAAPAIPLDHPPPAAGALVVAVGGQAGHPSAALGITARSGPAWRSMRGGEIDARIELDLSLRREAEGGVVLDAEGGALGMAVFGPRRRVLVIPGPTIDRIATQLEAHGKALRGYLGLGLQPVRLGDQGGIGAMVMSVEADGPGAKAGVHQGDVIVAWNGAAIASVGALIHALGPATVGTSIAMALRRGGETIEVNVVIGERP